METPPVPVTRFAPMRRQLSVVADTCRPDAMNDYRDVCHESKKTECRHSSRPKADLDYRWDLHSDIWCRGDDDVFLEWLEALRDFGVARLENLTVRDGLVEDIARNLEPHRLTYYLEGLASSFHRYFNLGNKNPEHRILTDDESLTQARLCLVKGVRIVLKNGLTLLGINAPTRM